jgi:two-component system alkaline phosphatase synthesis response regulator PhoP
MVTALLPLLEPFPWQFHVLTAIKHPVASSAPMRGAHHMVLCYNLTMMKKETGSRILVVEDDESILEAVTFNLKKQGYQTFGAENGLKGLRMLRQQKPDLMILDLMLPEMDGWKVCEQVRKEGNQIPILIVSARTSEFDKVNCLSIGADDYLTKPFSMAELVARVGALLRRSGPVAYEAAALIEAGPLSIDPVKKEALSNGDPLRLTPKEFAVLYFLASRSPQAVSREEIYQKVWGYEMLHGDRSVDVFVKRIRTKLARQIPSHSFLHTHHGFGYKFEVKETAPPHI